MNLKKKKFLDTGRIDWNILYRNLNLTIFVISLLTCIIKPEFIGLTCSVVIHGIYINNASLKLLNKINLFVKIMLGNILYDITLLILNFTVKYFYLFIFIFKIYFNAVLIYLNNRGFQESHFSVIQKDLCTI